MKRYNVMLKGCSNYLTGQLKREFGAYKQEIITHHKNNHDVIITNLDSMAKVSLLRKFQYSKKPLIEVKEV